MDYLLKQFLPQIEFSSYEEFHNRFTINVPDGFNFGYDVVDAWAEAEPEKRALLNTYHLIRRGGGKVVNRNPEYHFEDLAYRYANKIMQPLLVTLEPDDTPAKLITHGGQEFNLVLEGTVILTLGDKEFTMTAGDSIYFNPTIPHGQRCGGDVKARFLTVIAE